MKRHPYDDFLHRLSKPSRYIGGEYLSVRKPSADIRFALAFPEVYEIGSSHLGFKILYGILNACPDIAAERVFAPWPDLEEELRARGLPLVSLESYLPLDKFDVIGFSLQYEMTYTNVLAMLDVSRIPLRSSQRGEDAPLIAAGGPCATHAEPMAPFIDVFAVGDGERLSVDLARLWKGLKRNGLSRSEALMRLSAVEGLYVPSAYETKVDPQTGLEVVAKPLFEETAFPVRRCVLADLSEFPYPDDSPVAHAESVFDRFSVEIARGCTQGCRFCQAGIIYRPERERPHTDVVNTVLSGLDRGGYESCSLTALSSADYSEISPLLSKAAAELRGRDASLGISSLRAYGLAEDVLDSLVDAKATGLTFAPEAGTQRLRDAIAKNVTQQDIVTAARRVFERGWKRIKLYFMIGLPTETLSDVEAIADCAAMVAEEGLHALGRRPEINVSVSTHVPKPHTPFQWAAMITPDDIARKQSVLFGLMRKRRLKLRCHDSRMSFIEGVLARGDRRVAGVVEAAFRKGCRFDGWDEMFRFDLWKNAFAANGVEGEKYLRELPVETRLPWDVIDVGVTASFLVREYRRALEGIASPPCGRPAEGIGKSGEVVCHVCGLDCDLRELAKRRSGTAAKASGYDFVARGGGVRRLRSLPPSEGPSFRVRLIYAKLPPASYFSHLDLVRMIPRHFRRAGLALSMGGGFHPKPAITFGPALGLGVLSICEIVEVTVSRKVDEMDLTAKLNAVAEDGVLYCAAIPLHSVMAPLGGGATGAEYLVSIPKDAENFEMQRLRSGPLPVRRERKGRVDDLDARDFIEDAGIYTKDLPGILRAYLQGPFLSLKLRMPPQRYLSAKEVARAVLGADVEPIHIARVALRLADGTIYGRVGAGECIAAASPRTPD